MLPDDQEKSAPVLPGLVGTAQRLGRRAFIVSAAAAVSAAAFWGLRRSTVAAAEPSDSLATVTVVEFSADGKRTGTVTLPRVTKTDAEWRKLLAPASYWVTRHADTERPFTGDLLEEHGRGIFRCICCDLALFSSDAKFDSGTGWPSFWQPIAKENVLETVDSSLFEDPHRGLLPPVRRASGPRLQRRPRADRPALLHELGGAAVCEVGLSRSGLPNIRAATTHQPIPASKST